MFAGFFKYSNLDNIVFDGRNKLYGAYPLRKKYVSRLIIATSSICLIAIFIASFYYSQLHKQSQQKPIDLTKYDGFDLRMEENPIEHLPGNMKDVPHEEPPKKEIEEKNTSSEENKIEQPKTFTEKANTLDPNNTKVENKPKDAENAASKNKDTTSNVSKNGLDNTKGKADSLAGEGKNNMLVNRKGGVKEFTAWIQQNFVYPTTNKLDLDCIIIVELVVDEIGNMVDIKIAKGINNQYYNDEVLRVAKSYKGWFVDGFKLDPTQKKLYRKYAPVSLSANPKGIK